jgi:hypothetical protein
MHKELPLRRIYSLLLFLSAFLATSPLAAEPVPLRGHWRQVASNAGACDTCRVSIERHGNALLVTANNGWKATVIPDQAGGLSAKGEGQWGPDSGGSYRGQPFQIIVATKDSRRMWMAMSVKSAKGRQAVIQAIFELESPPAAASTTEL